MNSTVTRTISGAVFLVIMIAGLLLNQYVFAALMLFIMVVMMLEFYRMTVGEEYKGSRFFAILSGVTLFILFFFHLSAGVSVKVLCIAIFPLIAVLMASLDEPEDKVPVFSNIFTGVFYIAAPVTLFSIPAFVSGEFNGMILLCFFIIIWVSDVGAYCFGMLLGKKFPKKLSPIISPKKTWVGAIGGFIVSIIAGVVLNLVGWLNFPMVHCMVVAALMNIAGVYGDLFESHWKRCYGVKDSGKIMPGHGGLLDRFDSSLFAIPVAIAYLVSINLI